MNNNLPEINNNFIKKNFNILYTLFFGFSSFILINRHEMWRDELQAWLIARDSANIIELFKNLRIYREGHPGLWHFILFPLTRIFKSPYSMQIIHIIISTLVIFLIIKFSPFNKVQKLFLTFNYFLFFEYSIISRNYGLGVFFTFLFCIFFKKFQKNIIVLSCILFLLSQTSFMGLILAISLFLTLILEDLVLAINNQQTTLNINPKKAIIALFISLSGFWLSYYQIFSPAINTNLKIPPSTDQIINTGESILGAFFPIPNWELRFWDSTLFLSSPFFIIFTILLFFLINYIFIKYLKNSPSSLFLYFFTFSIFSFFFLLKFSGYIRHHGFIIIALITAFWIYKYTFKKDIEFAKKRTFNFTFNVFLLIQAFAGITAARLDYIYPFSSAKETANFILQNNLENHYIIGLRDVATSAVIGYLNKNKKIYYIQSKREGSFIKWTDKKKWPKSSEIIEKSEEISSLGKDVILLLNFKIKRIEPSIKDKFQIIYTSRKPIRGDERFFIYIYKN